jgi:hypothetical protein
MASRKITPRTIIWSCHGYDVRLDEDGVALIATSAHRHLEEGELRQLLEVVGVAFAAKDAGRVPIPTVDGVAWEERSRANQAARLAQVASQAIRTELIGPDDQAPF